MRPRHVARSITVRAAIKADTRAAGIGALRLGAVLGASLEGILEKLLS
jgi:hypothetical protein